MKKTIIFIFSILCLISLFPNEKSEEKFSYFRNTSNDFRVQKEIKKSKTMIITGAVLLSCSVLFTGETIGLGFGTWYGAGKANIFESSNIFSFSIYFLFTLFIISSILTISSIIIGTILLSKGIIYKKQLEKLRITPDVSFVPSDQQKTTLFSKEDRLSLALKVRF